jgi:hypothetical protein
LSAVTEVQLAPPPEALWKRTEASAAELMGGFGPIRVEFELRATWIEHPTKPNRRCSTSDLVRAARR